MTNEDKRSELKNKVAAAEKRNSERSLGDYAREAADSGVAFARDHPITAVAAGLALGALVASVIPGPGRRLRKKATRRGSLMAAMLGEIAAGVAGQLLEGVGRAAKDGQRRLGDLGETLADGAGTARGTAREVGRAAARTLRGLGSRTTH